MVYVHRLWLIATLLMISGSTRSVLQGAGQGGGANNGGQNQVVFNSFQSSETNIEITANVNVYMNIFQPGSSDRVFYLAGIAAGQNFLRNRRGSTLSVVGEQLQVGSSISVTNISILCNYDYYQNIFPHERGRAIFALGFRLALSAAGIGGQ
ncbi:MAG: hypothetical protein M1549_03160 [Candidatus Dependentiae bacterium]|nr:hypothetical protein [Candidatus Dependentiae bacterium]